MVVVRKPSDSELDKSEAAAPVSVAPVDNEDFARSVSERKFLGDFAETISTSGSSIDRPNNQKYVDDDSTVVSAEPTSVAHAILHEEGTEDIDDVVVPTSSNSVVSEGWRYFLQSGQLSLIGISLVGFCLMLSIWNFWRAVTYTLSPIPDMIHLRCILNSAICLASIGVAVCVEQFVDARYENVRRHVRVLCNVLGGIGLWELVESVISYYADNKPQIELIIYAAWLVVCIIIVFVLYKWKNISVVDSSLMSPV